MDLHTDMVTLYGRTGLITEAVQADEPVLLITGDSGVGKSALLTAALEEGQAQGQVTTLPTRRLEYRPGALQHALLEQLADVTASLLVDKSLVERAGGVILGAARQVARDRGRELALVVGKELLSIVKARLGVDAGQALGEYVAALVSEQEQSLLARLRASADPDALSAWLAFAAEVANFADGATVVLGIDDADRLSDPDLRQLADLVSTLPPRVRVYAGHLTAPTTDLGRIRLLRDAGAGELPVTGLDMPAVREWMEARQLDTRMAARIHRLTGGYPVFIDDALAVLGGGGSLRDIETSEMFSLNTRDALRNLDVGTARAARLLSAYADPPPMGRLLDILGIDEAGWTEMRDRLVQSRLFAATVDGQPWFHELRRRAVWTGLGNDERSSAADRALADLQDWFDQSGNPEALVAMALIAVDSQQARADPMASYSLEASVEEVAVCCAVLEIAEPAGEGPDPDIRIVMGDALLAYAQQTYHSTGDLLTALRQLSDRGLLVVVSNEYASVVVPRFTTLAAMLLAGRAGADLGRLPLPRLSTNLFRSVIALRLGQFEDARFGLGAPAISNLCASIANVAIPRRSPPAVLARGLVAGQPFYFAATFSNTDLRAQAAARLNGLVEPFLNDRAIVTDILEYPLQRVPLRRFLRAISRIVNTPLNRVSPRLPVERQVDVVEAIQSRADTLRLVRALCTQLERYALEIEEPIRLVFASRDDVTLFAEILGGEDGFIELNNFPEISLFGNDPYERYVLREQLNLRWNQSVRRIETRSGRSSPYDPVVETLVTLSKRAESFNKHQPHLEVPLQTSSLQALLAEADQRCFEDATALHAALTLTRETHPPQPMATLVAVCPDLPEYGWVEGAHAIAGVAAFISSSDRNSLRVHVSASTHRPDFEQVRQAFRSGFEFELPAGGLSGPRPEQQLLYSTYGQADSVLAELLGHRRDDIQIRSGPALTAPPVER